MRTHTYKPEAVRPKKYKHGAQGRGGRVGMGWGERRGGWGSGHSGQAFSQGCMGAQTYRAEAIRPKTCTQGEVGGQGRRGSGGEGSSDPLAKLLARDTWELKPPKQRLSGQRVTLGAARGRGGTARRNGAGGSAGRCGCACLSWEECCRHALSCV